LKFDAAYLVRLLNLNHVAGGVAKVVTSRVLSRSAELESEYNFGDVTLSLVHMKIYLDSGQVVRIDDSTDGDSFGSGFNKIIVLLNLVLHR
jgi:hypothetical protein